MRIGDLLQRNAELYAAHPAVVVVGHERVTYAELRARVLGLARALAAAGVGRGDRVALLAGNGLVYFDVYLATAHLGASTVPLNTRLADPELRFILDDAEPALAIADAAHEQQLAGVLPDGVPLHVVDDEWYAAAVAAGHDSPPSDATEDDVALIIYTSGTTGRPKGVCLSQRALVFNAFTLCQVQGLQHDDVYLSITPLYHAATGCRVTTMLADGQTHVVLPEFSAESCLAAIEAERVTTMVAVPTQLRRLLRSDALATTDLSSLRVIVYGAAPSALELIREARDVLPCGLYQGYGLTEATTNLTGLLPADHEDATDERLLSCGRPVPGVLIELRDESGAWRVARGEVGEIWVRSEKLMSGYWRNPEATAATIVDGWLRTGDLAREGEDGYLWIAGRSKEMLISGGVNVYPSEIELVLEAHPDVVEAAVVGRTDDEWGEVPVAFVLATEGRSPSADELESWCRTHLAGLKVPRAFVVVDDFPRTATGKIRKVELRESLSKV